MYLYIYIHIYFESIGPACVQDEPRFLGWLADLNGCGVEEVPQMGAPSKARHTLLLLLRNLISKSPQHGNLPNQRSLTLTTRIAAKEFFHCHNMEI